MAHDSSLPPGSILLRTMPLIVPRYGGALLFMAVHARCSDRSSVLSLFSLPLSLSCFPIFPARLLFLLLLLLYVRNRGIKKEEAKNGKIEIIGYPDRCYLNLFLMMLNHPLPSISFTYRKSLYNLSFRCIEDWLVTVGWRFPSEFEKKKSFRGKKLEQQHRTSHRRTI